MAVELAVGATDVVDAEVWVTAEEVVVDAVDFVVAAVVLEVVVADVVVSEVPQEVNKIIATRVSTSTPRNHLPFIFPSLNKLFFSDKNPLNPLKKEYVIFTNGVTDNILF